MTQCKPNRNRSASNPNLTAPALRRPGISAIARAAMSAVLTDHPAPGPVTGLATDPDHSFAARQRRAIADLAEATRLWRLFVRLGWLDIRLRYRGSLLGPFWLTLSTGVTVLALGLLYSTLFHINVREFLPFIALSMVLWSSGLAIVVAEACTCFVEAEGVLRSMRMPYSLYPMRILVRNAIALAHSILVIIVTFAIFDVWPGWDALLALPALVLWVIDGLAAGLLLGAFCARFRDIPPIINSVMQIAFFLSAVIWKPEQIGKAAAWLPLDPFFAVLQIVRAPLLGELPTLWDWVASLGYSVVLCAVAWLLFVRVRGRLAFWV